MFFPAIYAYVPRHLDQQLRVAQLQVARFFDIASDPKLGGRSKAELKLRPNHYLSSPYHLF